MEKPDSTDASIVDCEMGSEDGEDIVVPEVDFPLILGGKSMMELAALTLAMADDTAS